jgi:hypothetical protein
MLSNKRATVNGPLTRPIAKLNELETKNLIIAVFVPSVEYCRAWSVAERDQVRDGEERSVAEEVSGDYVGR